MAVSSSTARGLALAMMMVAGIFLSGNHQVSAAKQTECQNDSHVLEELVSNCAAFVMKSGEKVKPSQACCDVVKAVDVPCICRRVTKDIEAMIDMAKVVYVAGCCGKKLASGTKCGSYKVPAA